jgi:hypothetical protein
MPKLTANDLKIHGITAIETALIGRTETVISVNGIARYVVMDIEQYRYLRECELDVSIAENKADMAAGRYKTQTVQEHVDELMAEIASAG